jgi:hypothetical protein
MDWIDVVGTCKCVDDPVGTIKWWEFLDQLITC